jgi:hypothetical protein
VTLSSLFPLTSPFICDWSNNYLQHKKNSTYTNLSYYSRYSCVAIWSEKVEYLIAFLFAVVSYGHVCWSRINRDNHRQNQTTWTYRPSFAALPTQIHRPRARLPPPWAQAHGEDDHCRRGKRRRWARALPPGRGAADATAGDVGARGHAAAEVPARGPLTFNDARRRKSKTVSSRKDSGRGARGRSMRRLGVAVARCGGEVRGWSPGADGKRESWSTAGRACCADVPGRRKEPAELGWLSVEDVWLLRKRDGNSCVRAVEIGRRCVWWRCDNEEREKKNGKIIERDMGQKVNNTVSVRTVRIRALASGRVVEGGF